MDQAANAAGRVLLTLDKGMADIQNYPVRQNPGVVLFRPDAMGRRAVLNFVRERRKETVELNWLGRLTVVGSNSIRFSYPILNH